MFTRALNKNRSAAGIALVEMVVALALSVIVLGAAFNYFDGVESMTESVSAMSDVNENLRGSANLMERDLYAAGTGVPATGIPSPSFTGSTPVNRPGPGNTTFPSNCSGVPPAPPVPCVPVITPGYQLSGTIDGQTSDEITIVKVDDQWLNNGNQNQMWNASSQNWQQYGLSVTTSSGITYSPSNGYTVTATFQSSSCPPCAAVTVGDLLMFSASTASGQSLNSLGMVTLPQPLFSTSNGTTTVTLTFGSGSNDSLGLNQYCGSDPSCSSVSPPAGTIDWVQKNATYPNQGLGITLTKIDMITYYLDSTNPAHPYMLIRLLGDGTNGNGSNVLTNDAVAYGINYLSINYDVPPANLGVSSPACPSDCPNEIHTVNLTLSAISSNKLRKSGQYYGNTIASRVTVRNLDYGNAYK